MRKPFLPLAAALFALGTTSVLAQGYPAGGGPNPADQERSRPAEDQMQPQARHPSDEPGGTGPEMRDQTQPHPDAQARPEAEQTEMRSGAPHPAHTLTVAQKTKIRTTVLKSAPHVDVNFRVNVGAVVPRTVRLAPVPTEIVDVYPQWSGYLFFADGDEVVVVDPNSYAIVGMFTV